MKDALIGIMIVGAFVISILVAIGFLTYLDKSQTTLEKAHNKARIYQRCDFLTTNAEFCRDLVGEYDVRAFKYRVERSK